MIRLTDWETGEAVFVNESKMDVVRRLPASVHEYVDGPKELGERTRIQVGNDIFLVRETPEEVMWLADVTGAATAGYDLE